MFCSNCGKEVPDNTQFCTGCGASMVAGAPAASPAAAASVPPKSKLAAGLLGIILGGLGIHRFYLGYTAIGVIQLVLALLGIFTCGITTIASWLWGLIEGILILTGSISKDAQGNPLAD